MDERENYERRLRSMEEGTPKHWAKRTATFTAKTISSEGKDYYEVSGEIETDE